MKWYPMSKEDKKLRNKIEGIVFLFYTIGLFLFAFTKIPFFIFLTFLSIPICLKIK